MHSMTNHLHKAEALLTEADRVNQAIATQLASSDPDRREIDRLAARGRSVLKRAETHAKVAQVHALYDLHNLLDDRLALRELPLVVGLAEGVDPASIGREIQSVLDRRSRETGR